MRSSIERISVHKTAAVAAVTLMHVVLQLNKKKMAREER